MAIAENSYPPKMGSSCLDPKIWLSSEISGPKTWQAHPCLQTWQVPPPFPPSTHKAAADTHRHFFFIIITEVNTRCYAENFQLQKLTKLLFAAGKCHVAICQQLKLLAPCTKKERLQRKMTKDHNWIGA